MGGVSLNMTLNDETTNGHTQNGITHTRVTHTHTHGEYTTHTIIHKGIVRVGCVCLRGFKGVLCVQFFN